MGYQQLEQNVQEALKHISPAELAHIYQYTKKGQQQNISNDFWANELAKEDSPYKKQLFAYMAAEFIKQEISLNNMHMQNLNGKINYAGEKTVTQSQTLKPTPQITPLKYEIKGSLKDKEKEAALRIVHEMTQVEQKIQETDIKLEDAATEYQNTLDAHIKTQYEQQIIGNLLNNTKVKNPTEEIKNMSLLIPNYSPMYPFSLKPSQIKNYRNSLPQRQKELEEKNKEQDVFIKKGKKVMEELLKKREDYSNQYDGLSAKIRSYGEAIKANSSVISHKKFDLDAVKNLFETLKQRVFNGENTVTFGTGAVS